MAGESFRLLEVFLSRTAVCWEQVFTAQRAWDQLAVGFNAL